MRVLSVFSLSAWWLPCDKRELAGGWKLAEKRPKKHFFVFVFLFLCTLIMVKLRQLFLFFFVFFFLQLR